MSGLEKSLFNLKVGMRSLRGRLLLVERSKIEIKPLIILLFLT